MRSEGKEYLLVRNCYGLWLGCFVLFSSMLSAQASPLDSLLKVIQNARQDTNLVKNYNDICWEFINFGVYDSALLFGKKAEALSGKLNFPRGKAKALNYMGIVHYYQANYTQALQAQEKALKIELDLREEKAVASSYSNIGNVYYSMGNYPEAIDNHLKALAIREKLKDLPGQASCYGNLGNVYFNQKQVKQSRDSYTKAITLFRQLNNKAGEAKCLTSMATILYSEFKYQEAIVSLLEAEKIFIPMQDKFSLSAVYNNLGINYDGLKDFAKGMHFYLKSLYLDEEIGNLQGVANSCLNVGHCCIFLKQFKEAEPWFEKGLNISKQIGHKDFIKESYKGKYILDSMIAQSARGSGNNLVYGKRMESALKNMLLFQQYKDSLVNEKNTEETVKLQMQYDFDKKEAVKKAEQERKDVLAEKERQRQRYVLLSVSGGSVLIGIFLIIIYRRFRITRRQKEIIEQQKKEVDKHRELAESRREIAEAQREIIAEKQKEIVDSIQYARRIQQALLTGEEYIRTRFYEPHGVEGFMLYQPKDIVSGDFYWAVEHRQKFYLLIGDCTGHGVPGAFMSLLNINFLNEIVLERGLENPDDILNEQRRMIVKALNATSFSSEQQDMKDGMDCVLCVFDMQESTLTFAAANNPLWLIRKGELKPYKADKMPVGKYAGEERGFTRQFIKLEKGDAVYLFTDGFADQFGGPKNKKFMYRKLGQLIQDNAHLPMQEQKGILDRTMADWKGNNEQVDDICVFGIRV